MTALGETLARGQARMGTKALADAQESTQGPAHPSLRGPLQLAGHLLRGPSLTPSFPRKSAAFLLGHQHLFSLALSFEVCLRDHTCFILCVVWCSSSLEARLAGRCWCVECRSSVIQDVELLPVLLLCNPDWVSSPLWAGKLTAVMVEEGGSHSRLPGGGSPELALEAEAPQAQSLPGP